MTGAPPPRPAALAARVFLPFAFGYFISYLFRVVNNVIVPDLEADVGLAAGSLGLVTSAYFLTFAAAQLPLGVLLDRFGARRTEAALLLVAAAGAVVFAAADTVTGLILGRGLIGFGVAACLMAAFKAFVVWFPRDRLPLINGCQMAAGGLGALAATRPVELALTVIDWRTLFLIIAALTVIAAALLITVVPERPGSAAKETLAEQLRGIGMVFSAPLFWRVAPLTVASQASFLAIQGLWSGPWLRDVAGYDRDAVAATLSLIALAMIAGFLVMGWAATRIGRFGVSPFAVAVGGMMVFIGIELILALAEPVASAPVVWAAFGFFGTAGILPYAALSQRFPARLAGRLNTGINVLVFVIAFAAQWGTGAIIDAFPHPPGGGYDPAGYRAALLGLVTLQGLALGWFLAFRRDRVPEG